MALYRCTDCGAVFHKPLIRTWRENLDGERGWETRTEIFCPVCDNDQIEDYTEQDNEWEEE